VGVKQSQFSYDKIYQGSRLHPDIQRRLEALQKSAEKNQFGYSKFEWSEGSEGSSNKGKKNTMTYQEALQDRNFDGAGELSSRRPWVRFWTAIQPYKLERDGALSKAAKESGAIADTQVLFKQTPKYQQIWELGNEVWNSYQEGMRTPGASVNELEDKSGFTPGQYNSDNPYNRPAPIVNSAKSVTLGSKEGGLIRESTVDFSVFNMRDYENIILPYFLRPGAEVFLDYGWDTGAAYPRREHLRKGDMLESIFKYKTGYVDKSKGDMNVVYGLVDSFSSTVRRDGGYDCSVTIMSANFALLDFTRDNGPALAPLMDVEVNKTLSDYWQRAMGVELSPSYDAVYNTVGAPGQPFHSQRDDNVWRKHALLNLKMRVNEKMHTTRTKAGYNSTPWEPSDAEFETGIHYQPFKGNFAYLGNQGTFEKLIDIDIVDGKEQGDARAFEYYMQEMHKNWWNADPTKNVFVSFKWLEHFLNKHVGHRSKEGKDASIQFDMSSQIVGWNELVYHKQNLLRWMPQGFRDAMSNQEQFLDLWSRSSLDSSHSAAKWFLPPDKYTASSFPDSHYVVKSSGSGVGMDGYCSVGNIWMRIDWIRGIFENNTDFRKALKEITDTINKESHGLIRFRWYSGGADTRAVLVDTNVPAYTKPVDDGDKGFEDCEEKGGLYCAQELIKGSGRTNLTAIDADASANLFAFSIQSPDSIVYDASIVSNLQNNTVKTDLLLRSMPKGIPTFNVDAGWAESTLMKNLQSYAAKGNKSSKTTKIEDHWDYVPGFMGEDSKQRMYDEFSIRVTGDGRSYDASSNPRDYSFESLQAIYKNNEPDSVDWRQHEWEQEEDSTDGEDHPTQHVGQGDCTIHRTKEGETLGEVARQYQTNYTKIVDWNQTRTIAEGVIGISNPNQIKPDWYLCVTDPGNVGTHKSNVPNDEEQGEIQDALNNDEEPENQTQSTLPPLPNPEYVAYHLTTDEMMYDFIVNDPIEYFEMRLKEPMIWAQGVGDAKIPIELNMHIYGTSGIYCQNIVTIDYLPLAYREKTYFRIQKVEDIINSSGWKTGISAIMQYKNAGTEVMNSARGLLDVNQWQKTRIWMGTNGLQAMGYTSEDIRFFNNPDHKKFHENWFLYPPGIGGRASFNTSKVNKAYGDDPKCQAWQDILDNTKLSSKERDDQLRKNDWHEFKHCFFQFDESGLNGSWQICENEIRYGGNSLHELMTPGCMMGENPWIWVGDPDHANPQTDEQCELDNQRVMDMYDSMENSCCMPNVHPENCNHVNLNMCRTEWERFGDECIEKAQQDYANAAGSDDGSDQEQLPPN